MQITLELNGETIELDKSGITEIKGDFDNQPMSVTVTEFDLDLDTASIINDYVKQGLNGEMGYIQPITIDVDGYEIELNKEQTEQLLLTNKADLFYTEEQFEEIKKYFDIQENN